MSAELQGRISEIVGPHETELLAATRPDDIEREATRVAAIVGDMKDLNPVVRTGIIAVYGHSYLSSPSYYRELATRTVTGLTTLQDTLSTAKEGVGQPVLVQLEPNVVLSGVVSSDSLVLGQPGRVSPLTRPAASLHVANTTLATQRDVGIFPGVEEIAEDSGQNRVTLLEDGHPGWVVGLEEAATNETWVVIGRDAVTKRLSGLGQTERLLAAAAVAATTVGHDFDMSDPEYGINGVTRNQVIRDMTRYVIDVAADLNHVPEDEHDTPPEVEYDLTSMEVLTRMLKIDQAEIGIPAGEALDARLRGATSNAQAVKFAFARGALGDLLRPLLVSH